MLNKEALMMFKSGGIGKEELKKRILKSFLIATLHSSLTSRSPLEAG